MNRCLINENKKARHAGLFYVCPARAHVWRWKSSHKLATVSEGKRNCEEATNRGEEAWNEVAGRWTRTRYKAALIKASGHNSAKLLWSRMSDVNLAIVQ
jgi:hypothetical protein